MEFRFFFFSFFFKPGTVYSSPVYSDQRFVHYTFDGNNKTTRRTYLRSRARARLAVCLTVSLLCIVKSSDAAPRRIAKRETENQARHTYLITCSEHRGTRVTYHPAIRERAFDSTTSETTSEYSVPPASRETSRTNEIARRASREIDGRAWSIAFGGLATDWFKFSMGQLKYTSLSNRWLGSRNGSILGVILRAHHYAIKFVRTIVFRGLFFYSFAFRIFAFRYRINEPRNYREANREIRLKIPLLEARQLWNYYAAEVLLDVRT